MVGDRRYDISGAHAVGMRGLGYSGAMVPEMNSKALAQINWWN